MYYLVISMMMTYKEASAKAGGRYGLRRAIELGELKHVGRNLYATESSDSVFKSLPKLYPSAIVTGPTALYLHGLIDLPPEQIDVATKRGGSKIVRPGIRQAFVPKEWLNVGASVVVYDGAEVKAYDLERMLLELMRSRNKLPYDVYKEAVNSYRRLADKLDIYKLEEYADRIPRGQAYLNRALEEVF